MRRKDREITDPEKIRGIIERCYCCRLGFCDHGEVYIVPLSFGYEEADGTLHFYFHGAKEGRKTDLIWEAPEVGFELDTGYALNRADAACGYSAAFQSVIGNGRVCMVEDLEEKKKGLALLMDHSAGEAEKECSRSIGEVEKGHSRSAGEGDRERDRECTGNGYGAEGMGKRPWEFSRESLEAVSVFRLDVEKISCKEHL